MQRILSYLKSSTVAMSVVLLFFFSVAVNAEELGLLSRPSLAEVPGGIKERLQTSGVTVDASLTQLFQGLASGDGDQDIETGGKGDIILAFDGYRLGLWKGLSINMHGEFVYGDDLNGLQGGTLIPVNTALTFPGSDEELSLTFTQQLNNQSMLTIGKFNMLSAASRTPLLSGGGIETFMNLGLAAPISGVTPAYIIGGSLNLRTDFANLGLLVYDPRDAQDSDVLQNPFSDGVTFSLSANVPFRRNGTLTLHSIRLVHSTQEGIDLDGISLLGLPPAAQNEINTRSGYWFGSYAFQHFLFQEQSDPSKGWGIFGQIALSDGNPNPFQWSGFIGVGGNNLFPNRINDRFGLAYFRYSLSSSLVDGLRPIVSLEDEHGIEVFYNFAVTPWLRLTSDIQIIDPAFKENDRTVYFALRVQIKF